MKYDVLGIGNPVVDITAEIDESFLKENGIIKGVMNLVDKERADSLTKKVKSGKKYAAGSVANTIFSLSFLDLKCAFFGKIGSDDLGDFYKKSMNDAGIDFLTNPISEDLTGRSVILTTPDAERSMNTYLGASSFLSLGDMNADAIKNSSLIFGEGYLFDSSCSKEALLKAFDIAKENKKITVLTLSDKMCVKRYKDDFLKLINSGKIDILFGNEKEVTELYGDDWQKSLKFDVHELVVTKGSRGAMSVVEGKTYNSSAKKVEKIVDTTGAGDLFAAGYLYGVLNGHPPEQRLQNGVICSAEIITHYGTRPKKELKELI